MPELRVLTCDHIAFLENGRKRWRGVGPEWKLTIVYCSILLFTIVTFTLLHNTLLHEKYMSHGINHFAILLRCLFCV